MATIRYDHWKTAIDDFPEMLRLELDRLQPAAVCEVGGGANPALTLDEVAERRIDRYTVLDISGEELQKAPDGYAKLQADICGTLPPGQSGQFDFIFSRMLAEHVKHPADFHANVHSLLKPGGVAVHLMPTLYDPSFVANRLLPERLAHRVLRILQPTRRLESNEGKFPAYYRWCRGPSRRQIARLEGVGYEVEHVTGYFGTGYIWMLGPIAKAYEGAARRLIRSPKPALCSYAWWVLRRPAR